MGRQGERGHGSRGGQLRSYFKGPLNGHSVISVANIGCFLA